MVRQGKRLLYGHRVVTMDEKLFKMIEKEFGADAEEIIARIICGSTVDSAIQSVCCQEVKNENK